MSARIDVGAVIGRVFRIYVDQASVLMPAAAVVFVFTGILSSVLRTGGAGAGLLAELIALVAGMLFTGMVVELVDDVQDGRRDSSPGQLLRAVTPMLGQLILVAVAVGLAVLLGFVLFIVPGLVLLTIWAVVVPVIVLERPPGLQALARSRELVRGNGWQVFGVILVLDFLVLILGGLIDFGADASSTALGIVVTVVVGVLTAPLPALAAAVLYFDLRGSSAGGATDAGPADLV
jgi:hypothetical protein